ncbi:MAG: HAD-IA family hydrolase [Thalassotalea sp.]
MNNYQLYIFDWDGTLMDSVGRIVSSMQTAAQLANVTTPSIENAKGIIGMSLAVGIKKLFPDVNDAKREEIFHLYKEQYLELNETPTPLFPHTIEMLTALNKQDKIITIATGKARAGLDRIFAATKTEHFFHSTRTADDAESKPSPEMILQLLREFNVAPQNAVMIGDSLFDLQMAEAAGVDRIGVTIGAASREALAQFKPVAIVDSVAELAELIV